MYLELALEKPIILLADDHAEIVDFIADDLEDKYDVVKAYNGREALNYVYANEVDLIISDVMMPGLNGFEFCTNIKENEDYCHIPFVMLTAKNSLQSKIEGLEYGADAYIEKPFSPTFLQAQIASLLRNRKHVQKRFESATGNPIDTDNHNKSDKAFLKKLNKLVLENLADPSFCVDMLAEGLYMSRPTLYRKIKTLSDLSPNELIKQTKLKRAAQLLLEGELKVYEVADTLGFSTPSHFSRAFQKHFGQCPKAYTARRT